LFGGSLWITGRLDPIGEISKPIPQPGRAYPDDINQASYAQKEDQSQQKG
jgi:hypothetical protein